MQGYQQNSDMDAMAVAAVNFHQNRAAYGQRQQAAGQQNYDQYNAQQQQMQQQQMQMQDDMHGEDDAPPEVIQFLQDLENFVLEGNDAEVHNLYENTFNKLTEQFYQKKRWPSFEYVEGVLDNEVVVTLYKELYHRHVYSKMQPTFDDRLHSWLNYCSLLDYFLEVELVRVDEDDDGGLKLPVQWLWDMLDEFIYQFQTYPNYIAKCVKTRNPDLDKIKSHYDMWDSRKVLWYLHEFADKSNIRDYLRTPAHMREDYGTIGDAFQNDFTRYLGYFAVVGLLRMHSLFGDYWLAMKTIEDLDLRTASSNDKPLYLTATACHITVYYYMGFSYMMMRRYSDAIRTFTEVLSFLSRTRQFYTASYQYDNMVKKMDQMFALLMICHSMCPVRIEDSLLTHIKDKFQDKLQGLQRGEESAFEDIFTVSCPKFVSPAVPDFEDTQSLLQNEPFRRQLELFKQEVRAQAAVPSIRNNLKFYSAIPLAKLSQLTQQDGEDLVAMNNNLMCAKHKQHQVVKNAGVQESPLDGLRSYQGDIDFYVDNNMVHVNSTQTKMQYAEVFSGQINKFADLLARVKSLKIDDKVSADN